ncbi:MAG TPA: hypothetical protein VFK13_03975 [Gemmatimonadaceae bacterium]|nr:hypothetical protein [Gemmatimonadaceae bacterium]
MSRSMLAAIAASLLALPASAAAQRVGPRPLEARLYPYDFAGTRTQVAFQLNQPAYAAVFSITPGSGASMLFPGYTQDVRPLDAGYHAPLERPYAALQRWYYVSNPVSATSITPRLIVLIASRRPLDTRWMLQSPSALRRRLGIFQYTSWNPWSTADAIASLVVPTGMSDDDWAVDVYMDFGTVPAFTLAFGRALFSPLRVDRECAARRHTAFRYDGARCVPFHYDWYLAYHHYAEGTPGYAVPEQPSAPPQVATRPTRPGTPSSDTPGREGTAPGERHGGQVAIITDSSSSPNDPQDATSAFRPLDANGWVAAPGDVRLGAGGGGTVADPSPRIDAPPMVHEVPLPPSGGAGTGTLKAPGAGDTPASSTRRPDGGTGVDGHDRRAPGGHPMSGDRPETERTSPRRGAPASSGARPESRGGSHPSGGYSRNPYGGSAGSRSTGRGSSGGSGGWERSGGWSGGASSGSTPRSSPAGGGSGAGSSAGSPERSAPSSPAPAPRGNGHDNSGR